MPTNDPSLDAALIASPRRWNFAYQVIDMDGYVIGDAQVIQCTVSNNDLADKVKRTANMVLHKDTARDLDFLRDRIRVFAQLYDAASNVWHILPLGTFWLSAEKRTYRNKISGDVPVLGLDGLVIPDQDLIPGGYGIMAGTLYTDVVNNLLIGMGFPTPIQIPGSSLTLPAAKHYEPGTSKLTIINDLLGAINYRSLIITDVGNPWSAPYVPPEDAPILWEYKVDRSSVIIPGIDVELNLFDVPNQWIAYVSEPDRPLLVATATNSDPNSPLSTVSRGRTISQVVQADIQNRDLTDAATQAILQEKVDQAKAEATQQYMIAKFSTGIMPIHGSGDVCLIDYGEGAMRFKHHEWSIECKAGGRMNHVFRRVVTL